MRDLRDYREIEALDSKVSIAERWQGRCWNGCLMTLCVMQRTAHAEAAADMRRSGPRILGRVCCRDSRLSVG